MKKAKQRRRKFYRPRDVPVPHSETVVLRKKPRVMMASNEFHSGQAVWHYELGEWVCVQASDCLKFLLKNKYQAKLELLRRGFDWRWV